MTGYRKWILTFTVVLMTALEILDGTIVSVSVRNMQGSLAASHDQLSWMMTGYMITSAIVVLMTGYLSGLVGRRPLVLWCIVAFGAFSMACGLATSPWQVIVCRMLQGTFGGLLAPLAQTILGDIHDESTRPVANAMYGIGLMTAPVFGPILGGVITEHLGWRWDFFINLPVCALAFFLVYVLLDYHADDRRMDFDWLGFILLVIGVGFLQYVLDNGNEKGWFDSHLIVTLTLTAVAAQLVFILRGLQLKARNLVNFEVMRDRAFVQGVVLMFVFCMGFVGSAVWLPNYLESFMGYPATTAGMTMAPRGLASAVSMFFIPLLMRSVSTRWLLMAAFGMYVVACWMMVHMNPWVDQTFFVWSNVLQGVASGLFFIPLSTSAYSTLVAKDRGTASGLFNFFRAMGSSVGVALFATIVTQQTQVNWHRLGGKITPTDPAYMDWLRAHHFVSPSDPTAAKMVSMQLYQQASTIAFADAFAAVMWLFAAVLPVLLFFRWQRVQRRAVR